MRYAVLADIHGNLEALQTAIEYAHKQQLSHFLVLGDSIGYGANPNECLEWVLQNAEGHVLGNHEAAIIHEKIRWKFTDWARVAIDWTAEKLQPGFVAKIKDLPYLEIQNGLTLAHGTLHSPEQFGYLFTSEDAHRSFLAMETRIGFVGHSHVPCFFSEKGQEGRHLDPGIMKLQKGRGIS